uniref:Uncharacterized protein n=1 Tax=Oryza rufipogon TaxID=4529 RepID=A0A0E0QB66_ORYRU
MEAMQALMKRMQLSEAEKKGIRICEAESGSMGSGDPKAIGKVLAEKVVNAEESMSDLRLLNGPNGTRGALQSIMGKSKTDVAWANDNRCVPTRHVYAMPDTSSLSTGRVESTPIA